MTEALQTTEPTEAMQVRELAEGFQVVDDTTATAAQEMLIAVVERQKLIAEQLKYETDLFKQGLERLTAQRKPDLDAWTAAGAALRMKIAGYVRVRQLVQVQAAEDARVAALAGAPAETVQALVIQSAAPSVEIAGISTRAKWKAQVTDFKALVASVAAGTVPLDLLGVDTKALDKLARATKGPSNIPGVLFINEGSIAVTAPKA